MPYGCFSYQYLNEISNLPATNENMSLNNRLLKWHENLQLQDEELCVWGSTGLIVGHERRV